MPPSALGNSAMGLLCMFPFDWSDGGGKHSGALNQLEMLRFVTVNNSCRKESVTKTWQECSRWVCDYLKRLERFSAWCQSSKGCTAVLRLWVHATDQDSRRKPVSSLALASQEFVAVNRALSSAHLCSLLQGKPARAPGVVHIEEIASRGQEAPNTRPASPTSKRNDSEPVSWKWVGRVPDHVTAQASTNCRDFWQCWARPTGPSFIHLPHRERQQVFKQRLKRLALTWARCVHR